MPDAGLFREVSPPAPLSAFVRRVWGLDLPADGSPERIVPDGCCEIVLTLEGQMLGAAPNGEPAVRPRTILVGQMSRATAVQPLGPVRLVGIRLHPWAAAAFLGCSASDATDRVIDLRVASPALHAGLCSATEGVPHLSSAMAGVIAALQAYVARRPRPGSTVEYCVELIRASPELRVRELARRIGWSEHRLQRTFAVEVGIAPKALARITRIQRAIRLAEREPRQTWAGIAARCGYVDQSHLVRDFGELAGCTPTSLRAEPQPLRDRLLFRD